MLARAVHNEGLVTTLKSALPVLCLALLTGPGCLLQPATYDTGSSVGDLGVKAADQGSASTAAAYFKADIQKDLDALGCTASACHGSNSSPLLHAMPSVDADWMANYTNIHSDCTTLDCLAGGASSLLLTKPLAGSVKHGGTKPFASTADPIYRRWLAWTQAGAPYDANGTPPVDMSPPPVDMSGGADMGPKETVKIDFTSTASPSGAGSQFSPKNVVAVWIENNGTFVKTASRWANTRKGKLVGWVAKAGAADVDAVSGATRPAYGAMTATWDMTARAGGATPADGTYTIRMELADSNATQTTENNQGTFTFNRNGTVSTQANVANGGFTNVTITYSGRP